MKKFLIIALLVIAAVGVSWGEGIFTPGWVSADWFAQGGVYSSTWMPATMLTMEAGLDFTFWKHLEVTGLVKAYQDPNSFSFFSPYDTAFVLNADVIIMDGLKVGLSQEWDLYSNSPISQATYTEFYVRVGGKLF